MSIVVFCLFRIFIPDNSYGTFYIIFHFYKCYKLSKSIEFAKNGVFPVEDVYLEVKENALFGVYTFACILFKCCTNCMPKSHSCRKQRHVVKHSLKDLSVWFLIVFDTVLSIETNENMEKMSRWLFLAMLHCQVKIAYKLVSLRRFNRPKCFYESVW